MNQLNLASRPFNNRVLPWTLTVVILFVSMIGLVLVVHLTTDAKKKASVLQTEINELRQKEQALLKVADDVKKSFTDDERKALAAAHQLVDRKSFSWMRLLTDLENALPNDVRVSRISVRNVAADQDQVIAELDLAVFAKSPTTITKFIASTQQAGVFNAVLREQNLQKGRGESGTEYVLEVVYRPRPGYTNESVAEVTSQSASNEVTK